MIESSAKKVDLTKRNPNVLSLSSERQLNLLKQHLSIKIGATKPPAPEANQLLAAMLKSSLPH